MNIHFIGIGGIGVSALARYYLARNHQVSGSDLTESEITESLKQQGANVFIGHRSEHVTPEVDRVIYSAAIEENNPELKKAERNDIETQSYAEALGNLTEQYFTIAVAGTHGKSTTAAMVASILIEAGLNPSVILGTKFDQLEYENCRVGEKYLVIEADEWKASFLNYYPQIITLTNIEAEHLDFYENLEQIIETYQEFISHLPDSGKLVINRDDSNIEKLKPGQVEVKEFSFQQSEVEKLKEILRIPGRHNIYNALAALNTARSLDIPDRVSFKALSDFKGVWRRFDLKERRLKNGQKIKLINDYAHHPTEVESVLETVSKEFPDSETWAVFQPHQFLRTTYLFDDFVKTFREAPFDRLLITDIYEVAGREQSKEVSASDLAEEVKKDRNDVEYVAQTELKSYLLKRLKQQVLVIMGAGDIYQLEKELTE